jgi:hypothetical protein
MFLQHKFSSLRRKIRVGCARTCHSYPRTIITLSCVVALMNGDPQIDSGSVVIIGYSQEKIIVATDSRTYHGQGRFDDNSCKIIVLTKNILFSPGGNVAGHISEPTGWDAVREVRTALVVATKESAPPDFMHRVAAEWSEKMKHKLEQGMTERDWQSLENRRLIVAGYFAGLDEGGNIETVAGKLYRSQEGPNSVRSVIWKLDQPRSLEKSMRFRAFGEGDVFNELMAGQTERAKQETRKLESEVAGMDLNDADIHKAIRYVQLSIQYAPHPEVVGGEVDVAQLNRGGTLRWIHRKPQCTDEQPDTKSVPPHGL